MLHIVIGALKACRIILLQFSVLGTVGGLLLPSSRRRAFPDFLPTISRPCSESILSLKIDEPETGPATRGWIVDAVLVGCLEQRLASSELGSSSPLMVGLAGPIVNAVPIVAVIKAATDYV